MSSITIPVFIVKDDENATYRNITIMCGRMGIDYRKAKPELSDASIMELTLTLSASESEGNARLYKYARFAFKGYEPGPDVLQKYLAIQKVFEDQQKRLREIGMDDLYSAVNAVVKAFGHENFLVWKKPGKYVTEWTYDPMDLAQFVYYLQTAEAEVLSAACVKNNERQQGDMRYMQTAHEEKLTELNNQLVALKDELDNLHKFLAPGDAVDESFIEACRMVADKLPINGITKVEVTG